MLLTVHDPDADDLPARVDPHARPAHPALGARDPAGP